ncbi:MAG TPA: hypothetical protein VK973_00020 [Arenicellales bacterium]|nr:hypothetical protein [Arenicellales bacterium]
MTERIQAWRCIGCGRIDGPQPCIGICEDRPAELVDAGEYDRLAARAVQARQYAESLEGFLRRLAFTTPRSGEWERSYKTFQKQARRLLDAAAKAHVEEP